MENVDQFSFVMNFLVIIFIASTKKRLKEMIPLFQATLVDSSIFARHHFLRSGFKTLDQAETNSSPDARAGIALLVKGCEDEQPVNDC